MTACARLQEPVHKFWRRPALTVGLILAGLTAARAGGQMTFGDDTNTSANDGPIFFGFVRDADGAAVADARVTAAVKSGGAVVTTTNSIGVYKIPGFAKSINPDDITISCSKNGYVQANVVRRPHTPGDMTDPIEVECYLQKG
jgi:Carboxypeptidase regulatory-like domain